MPVWLGTVLKTFASLAAKVGGAFFLYLKGRQSVQGELTTKELEAEKEELDREREAAAMAADDEFMRKLRERYHRKG